MWKIIFVEDEPFVRRSIIQLIDWETRGFQIIGEADDGEEALAQIKSLKPDLVISDILMPNMNGLELIQHAKASGFEGLFVMLTAMNEFEYARQALEYGAFGYELKLSMSPDSIYKMLDKASNELLSRSLTDAKMDCHYAYETMWELLAVQSGSAEALHLNIEQIWAKSRHRYAALYVILHGGEPLELQQQEQWIGMQGMEHEYMQTFTAYGVTTCFCLSDRPLELKKMPQYAVPWTVICCAAVEINRLPEVWLNMLYQLNGHWYDRRPGVYWLKDNLTKPNLSEPVDWKHEIELYRLIENGQAAAAVQLLTAQWTLIEQQGHMWIQVKDAALRISRWLQRQVPAPLLLQQIAGSITHAELLAVLVVGIERCVKERTAVLYPVTDHSELNQLMQYIHAHYAESLTLKLLAKRINLDEKYLSGLFAKKIGEPFIQYLQNIRIEKAKQLLVNSDLPINEIGLLVGFANANYFFKIFKRWCNLTPNEYRRHYGKASC
ncbi:response regulator [Paenibacillaceae bacterium]|nr:response regulator [Paenibacillaceae bacterium]